MKACKRVLSSSRFNDNNDQHDFKTAAENKMFANGLKGNFKIIQKLEKISEFSERTLLWMVSNQ